MASTVFNQPVKHGKIAFAPGVPYGFEDPDAGPYFVALGWAADDEADPVVVITLGEIDIDPLTTHGTGANKGAYVMPDRAAAALAAAEEG